MGWEDDRQGLAVLEVDRPDDRSAPCAEARTSEALKAKGRLAGAHKTTPR